MVVIWRLKWMKKNIYVKDYMKHFSFLRLNQIIVFDYGSLCLFAHMTLPQKLLPHATSLCFLRHSSVPFE